MKYAHEIIGLMSKNPGHPFRMAHLVRTAAPGLDGKIKELRRRREKFTAEQAAEIRRQRHAVQQGIWEVLRSLEVAGNIERVAALKSGSYALYRWKCSTTNKASDDVVA